MKYRTDELRIAYQLNRSTNHTHRWREVYLVDCLMQLGWEDEVYWNKTHWQLVDNVA